jgi:segregation and condensation protein A
MNPPAVSLEQFEGPLDLLLALVRRNELDITNLPIAEITRQYLAYLARAEALELELGSEFTYMAATLIHIKSRMLLPPDPEIAAEEPDPRGELVRQLLDHEEVRRAAEFLHQQLEVSGASWSKTTASEVAVAAEDEPGASDGSMNLVELLRLARQAVEIARTQELLGLGTPEVSVEEMADWLRQRVASAGPHRTLCGQTLLAEQSGHPRTVALFLAMLELARTQEIFLEQERPFARLSLKAAHSS